MTNQQGAPEALRLAESLERRTTIWAEKCFAALELRRLHAENERLAALVDAQQPAPSAAAAPDGWESVIHEIRSGLVDSEPSGYDNSGYRSFAGTVLDAVEDGLLKLAASQPSPTPQADSQPAADEDIAMSRTQDLAESGRWPSDWVEAYRRGYSDRAARALADSVTAPAAGAVAGPALAPSAFVNAAGIKADDKPGTVVRKLDAAFHDAVTFADAAQQVDARLWCVHVQGPDDVIAMPSKSAALEHANDLNALFGRHPYEEGDPIMRAVVIEWPHSADNHAADLAIQDATHGAAPTPPAQAADSVLEDADPLQGAANWLAEAHGQFGVAVLQGCLMIGYNRAKRLHDAAIAARKQGGQHGAE